MIEGWGNRAALVVRQQADEKARENALLLQEDKLRREQSPILWAKVKQLAREECESLNKNYGNKVALFAQADNFNLHIVLTVPGYDRRELHAAFSVTSAQNALTWHTSGHTRNDSQSEEYELIIRTGKVFFARPDRLIESPESIAETMLNALLLE